MKIREVMLSDIHVITKLWKDMMLLHQKHDRYFTIEEDAAKAYLKYAEDNTQSTSKLFRVCIDDNNEIVGYLLAEICEYPPIYLVKSFIEIIEMVVRNDQRRKGIGEHMLQYVQNWAKEKGISRVECRVAINNPVSQGFWKKNGFRAYLENLVLDI